MDTLLKRLCSGAFLGPPAVVGLLTLLNHILAIRIGGILGYRLAAVKATKVSAEHA